MAPMPGLDQEGSDLPYPASKPTAIAHESAPEDDVPRLFGSLMIALSYVLDVQDDPHLYHGWRVAAVSTAMAEQIMPERVAEVFFAGLLHDVGAMGQFSHMVHYPTLHDQMANPEVVAHPRRGGEIVRGIPGLQLAAELVADHHEWWNGSGYPLQKTADQISPGAQLIRAADSADIAKKLRPGGSPEQAMEAASLLTDIEVAPDVAAALRAVVSEREFHSELTDEKELLPLMRRIESRLAPPVLRPHSDVTGAFLTVFARVVDSKHVFTAGHSERVAVKAIDLARIMDLPHDEVTKVRFAGLLHDVGKVAISKAIVDKAGPLEPSEAQQIKQQPVLTMAIVADIAGLPELAWIAGHHHEHWDGSGYPDALAGEDIPLLSRILAVADAMEAITSERAHRPAMQMYDAHAVLREASGKKFDPQVVDAAHAAWGSLG